MFSLGILGFGNLLLRIEKHKERRSKNPKKGDDDEKLHERKGFLHSNSIIYVILACPESAFNGPDSGCLRRNVGVTRMTVPFHCFLVN